MQWLMIACSITAGVAGESRRPGYYEFDFAAAKPLAPGPYAGSFGFDFGSTATNESGGGLTCDRHYFLSAAVPEGNSLVTATFGDPSRATTNTVKAECRRLMVEHLVTQPGEFVTRSFVVNTRTPDYPGGRVRLKPRERVNEMVTWDDKLTLEFSGTRPVLRALRIEPATNVTTLFLAGDSTVCDQPVAPWNSWGQMLPRFFGPGVAVANYAESGESLRTSLAAHRFDKIFSVARPGDFLFVQFGHNDMKDQATNALEVYRVELEKVVARTRSQGVTPVLVTSMERKAGIGGNTLAGYPDAMRSVARDHGVALIDLNVASLALYRALGADLPSAFQDGTHHNDYGSYELAKCVVEGIRANQLALARKLASDVTLFNPAKPDDPRAFYLPESPVQINIKPEGN
jgi:lysophospholipase L1-like esterase